MTCIIVVQVRGLQMGILVDRVSEVAHVLADEIDDAPAFGADVPTDYLRGIAKTSGGRVRLLLDIDRVLTTGELARAAASAALPADAA